MACRDFTRSSSRSFSGNAYPFAVSTHTDFHLGIGGVLAGYRLALACHNAELAVNNMGNAEGPDAGLITLYSGNIKDLCFFINFTYFFRGFSPFISWTFGRQ